MPARVSGYASAMDEGLRSELAELSKAVTDLSERVRGLFAGLHGATATPQPGAELDATLARAARLAALRAMDPRDQ